MNINHISAAVNKDDKTDNLLADQEFVDWDQQYLVEVVFDYADDFLKIKETLTRIGIASKVNNTLYQSCHILHRKNKYFICHFKELFALDGKTHSITKKDIRRRNTIINLLQEWELLKVIDMEQIADMAPLYQIKILRYDEVKNNTWILSPKYNLGKFKNIDKSVSQ